MRTTLAICGALLLAGRAPLGAQGVLIAPQAAILDERRPTASFTLANPGAEPIEVEIGALFGLPGTDALGQLYLRTTMRREDSLASAVDWIEAFPERLVLAPGARRVVRVLVTPPAGAADREYWARLVITSRRGARAGDAADTASVRTALELEVRTILPLLFRKGTVHTALAIDSVAAILGGDSVIVRPALTPRGNAAWVGTVHVTLLDAQGRAVTTQAIPIGVYGPLDLRFALHAPGLAPGRYRVRVDGRVERGDIAAPLLLPAPPVSATASFAVP